MRRQIKKHSPLIYDLRDQARRHDLKLQGNGTLTKQTLDAHKRLICEAADVLRSCPPGDTVIIESGRDDVFVVVRSLEVKPPRMNQCCREAARSHFRPGGRDKMIVAPGAHKPSPPGRT